MLPSTTETFKSSRDDIKESYAEKESLKIEIEEHDESRKQESNAKQMKNKTVKRN